MTGSPAKVGAAEGVGEGTWDGWSDGSSLGVRLGIVDGVADGALLRLWLGAVLAPTNLHDWGIRKCQ